MKRIFSLVAVFVMLFSAVLSMSSCDRDYVEEDVISAARVLLKKAEPLNEIYYGKGLRCDELSSESVGNYRRVLDEELKKYGISTLDELKAVTREVFTYSFSEEIFSAKLNPAYDENGVNYARYIEHTLDISGEDKFIYADPAHPVYMTDKVEYKYETVKVKDVEDEYLFLAVVAVITNENGKSREEEIEFTLLEESSGWRLDSFTFAVYEELK